jgi:hypothetical protein
MATSAGFSLVTRTLGENVSDEVEVRSTSTCFSGPGPDFLDAVNFGGES